jgi:hypothetical protein
VRSVVGMGGQYPTREAGRERGARLIPLQSFDTDAVVAWLLTAAQRGQDGGTMTVFRIRSRPVWPSRSSAQPPQGGRLP